MDRPLLALSLSGATALHGPGAPLRLPTRKALALVALLLLEGATRRERLAQMLWPELEPTVARRNLRREVFRLREAGVALADEGLEVLRLEAVQPRWPAADDPPTAWLQGLEGAAGAELDDWLAEQRALLQRRWIDRLEADAEALVRSGDSASAQALRRHLHAHRLASGDWGAGSHFAEADLALAEPAPADAGASASAPSPTPRAPAGRWPFVGRAALLARIEQAVAAGQVVFVDGAPGVGKTRLALEAAAALGGALLVRCRPDDAAQPFASAARLLESLIEAAPDVLPERWVRRELSLLVPRWLDAGVPEPDAAGGTAAAERRARAFDTAWRTLARENFGAIVIDDWQWADTSSLALWNLDAPPDAALPVARLVVHRGAELPPAALQRRRRLLDDGHAVAVTVPALDDAELAELLQRLHGTSLGEPATRRLAEALQRTTGGNPMFVGETLRHLHERGALVADAELPRLPPGVREAVLARVYALGPVLRALLECASLAGEAASLRLLAHAMAADALDTARAVEHAVAAELLHAQADGRVRFVHDLIAQSLAESLSPARAQALHGRIADAMLALGVQAAGHGAGRLARQLALAGRSHEACGWHLRAAEAARGLGALGEAMDQCDAALASADDAALRVQALRLQAGLLRLAGSPPTVDAALDAALAAAQALGPDAVHDVLLDRAAHWVDTARVEPALALLDRLRGDDSGPVAEPAALQPAQAVRAAELTAAALSNRGQHGRAVALLRQALERLDPGALAERARVLGTLARSLAFGGEREACVDTSRERARLCELLGDVDGQAAAVGQLGAVLRDLGQRAEARAACTDALALARRGGSLKSLRVALYRMVVIETDESRFDAVLPLVEEGEALSPFWDSPDMQQGFLRLRQFVHQVRGEGEFSRRAAERMVEHARTLDNVHVRLGSLRVAIDLHLLLDDTAAASALLDEAEPLAAAAHGDEMSLEIATRRARCRQRQGDAEGALALADALLARAGPPKAEDRLYLAAVAADAALDRGDRAAAAARLAAAPADATLPEGTRFAFVLAKLRLALAGSADIAQAVQQAQALRAAGHVPALKAQALDRLLAQAEAVKPRPNARPNARPRRRAS
jgi:DNA-binding SARP family transcriptional activator